MYVNLIDLVVSRGCALLTGETHERYKLSKSESDEYKKVSADYFYTINAQVSPALVFMVSTLTIFSSICFRAFADYKSKVKRKKAEKEAEEKQKEAEIKALEMQRQFNEIAIQQQAPAMIAPVYPDMPQIPVNMFENNPNVPASPVPEQMTIDDAVRTINEAPAPKSKK